MAQIHLDQIRASIGHLFDALFAMGVEIEESADCPADARDADVKAIVELRGQIHGTISLSVPWSTARRMASLLLGREIGHDRLEVMLDAVGEVASMFAGDVKSRCEVGATRMSVPRIIQRDCGSMAGRMSDRARMYRCMSQCGVLWIELEESEHGAVTIVAAGQQVPTLRGLQSPRKERA